MLFVSCKHCKLIVNANFLSFMSRSLGGHRGGRGRLRGIERRVELQAWRATECAGGTETPLFKSRVVVLSTMI
jgi:hypothetical protein